MRVHSGVSYKETEMYDCLLCGLCFMKESALERHKLTHPNYSEQADRVLMGRCSHILTIVSRLIKFSWVGALTS